MAGLAYLFIAFPQNGFGGSCVLCLGIYFFLVAHVCQVALLDAEDPSPASELLLQVRMANTVATAFLFRKLCRMGFVCCFPGRFVLERPLVDLFRGIDFLFVSF